MSEELPAGLLLEVGCEELPAAFVCQAASDLTQKINAFLEEIFAKKFTSHQLCTPRRLISQFENIPPRQKNEVKEIRGPATKSAFDAAGQPLPPLIGFCKANGVEIQNAVEKEGYIWLSKQVTGRPTLDLLAENLPKIIASLTFPKSMRWGSSQLRFARPIRWILALYGGKVIEFEIEGIQSGNKSRGHRFYAPDEFEVRDYESFIAEFRERKVEPDPEVRKRTIVDQTKTLTGVVLDDTTALLDENVFLTEWPTAISGEFRKEHLDLPPAVLETALAKHEKMFSVKDANGNLTNRFIFVRNSGVDDDVRRGCEWVLNARLDDAQFFYREDQKHSLGEFLDKTNEIVFQANLGSVCNRSERLHDLCTFIATHTDAPPAEIDFAATAGIFAKADLSTGLVSEFPGLQGYIGGEYAKREGFTAEICEAIANHYQPQSTPHTAGQRTGVRLAIADALDKLAGYLGLGLSPTGSSDPYGLRRAATALIECAWNWQAPMPSYVPLFAHALELYSHQSIELNPERAFILLQDLFQSRYEFLLEDERYDLVEAAILSDRFGESLNPRAVMVRLKVLQALAKDIDFVQTAIRPINLVQSAIKKNQMVEIENFAQHLDSPSGQALNSKVQEIHEPLLKAVGDGHGSEIINLLRLLKDPINSFIDGTMIMVDDEQIRAGRLQLLHIVSNQLFKAGDFTKIVQS